MKYLIFILALSIFPACYGNPPAGTYDPITMKAYHADRLVQDLQALSETAINLNGTAGALHLSDKDTRLVRDFALAAAQAAQAYANGNGSLTVIVTGLDTLTRGLSTEAKANSTFAKVLAAVQVTVHVLAGGN
jgi:hypothetical protein